jgi:hypothetical protein
VSQPPSRRSPDRSRKGHRKDDRQKRGKPLFTVPCARAFLSRAFNGAFNKVAAVWLLPGRRNGQLREQVQFVALKVRNGVLSGFGKTDIYQGWHSFPRDPAALGDAFE